MQRKLLLTSAAVALVLGLAPAMAQVNSDRGMNREQASPQREQNSQMDRGRRAAPARTENRSSRDQSRSAQERNERSTTGENTRRDEDRAGDKARQTQRSNAEGASDASTRQGERTERNRASTREDNDRNRSTTRESNERNRATRGENERERSATERDENATRSRATTQRDERSAPTRERSTERERGVNERNASRESREGEQRTRVSASLDESHRSRLHTAVARLDTRPLTRVNFSVSVGTVVPRTVELRPLPASIVEIIPAYRDYDYFVVRNTVVIVEPETHKIVDVIARSTTSRAQVERKSRKVTLTSRQREVIHKRYATRRHITTGAGSQVEEDITVGERVPDTVVIRSFPEEIYEEVPPVRRYRYIERNDNIYLVDPGSRRVIEEID